MFYLQKCELQNLNNKFSNFQEYHLPINHFPNGEIICQLDDFLFSNSLSFNNDKPYIFIRWDSLNQEKGVSLSDEIMYLMLLVNAIRNHNLLFEYNGKIDIYLSINMLPYARQDRNTGNTSISNKVLINLLNSLDFAKISIDDIHSDASRVLFDNGLLYENNQANCFLDLIKLIDMRLIDVNDDKVLSFVKSLSQNHLDDKYDSTLILISPDAGAYKKVYDVGVSLCGYNQSLNPLIITAQKHRDVSTGKITNTHVNVMDDLLRHNPNILQKEKIYLLVVDDICDGGRTFIELSKAIDKNIEEWCLKSNEFNYQDIKHKFIKTLYVTHGLFSKGKEVVEECYDIVLAYNEKKSS